MMKQPLLSVVVPVYNEADNIARMYAVLEPVLRQESRHDSYEIIYVDDGSIDSTVQEISALRTHNENVKLLSLSRNFGKEIALAAGIRQAKGQAVIVIDGDGQHPVERIPEFIQAWKAGAQVVVGVRIANHDEGFVKRYGSRLFYALFNRISAIKMVPGSSDFRLIDHEVQQAFRKLHEPDTITRGLIDWLGYKPVYIEYAANARTAGRAGYQIKKLVRLAAHSFVSLSPVPLYTLGYAGLAITGLSFVAGLSIVIEQIMLGDPWHWDFTGTAMLSILVVFLVGLVLVSQGVMALYVSFIHTQSKRRPLYIIDQAHSYGIDADETASS